MIELQQVTKRYANGHIALENISFSLHPGEFVFLTGHSGAGKSTLLKLIAMIEAPSRGEIIFNNKYITRARSFQTPYVRRKMGIILQAHNLLLDKTVFDNVALPLIIAGLSYKEVSSRVRAILAKVALNRKENSFPHELSCGEQQRVSIARAVVNKPPLLIADEPTGNLDPDLASEIFALFETFNQLGMTILIASHDLALISGLNKRVLYLEKGRLTDAPVTA